MKMMPATKQSGFSLVEILMATALGIFLLAGITTAYISQKKTYGFNQGLARIQENGRIAMGQFNKDVRIAGYIGCGRIAEVVLYNLLPDLDFNAKTTVVGFHNGHSTAHYTATYLSSLIHSAVPGTDLLIVQHADVNGFAASNDQQIKIGDATGFKADDILLLSNCRQAHIFKVQEIHGQWVTPSPQFAAKYELADSQISRLLTIVFYVADTGRTNQAGHTIYALYRRNLNDPPTKQSEWIEGVENMQVQYGIFDPQTTAVQYSSADGVPDWEKIISVKIALLLDSGEEVCDHPSAYTFMGQTKTAPDRRLRKEWDTVINLRNRSNV